MCRVIGSTNTVVFVACTVLRGLFRAIDLPNSSVSRRRGFHPFAGGVHFAFDALGKCQGFGGVGLGPGEFVDQPLDPLEACGKRNIVGVVGGHFRDLLPSGEFRGEMIELGLDGGDAFELDVKRLRDFSADAFERSDTFRYATICGT